MEHRDLRKVLVAALAAAGCGRSEPDPPPAPPQPVGPAKAGLRAEDLPKPKAPPPRAPSTTPTARTQPPAKADAPPAKPFEAAACGAEPLRQALKLDYVGLRSAQRNQPPATTTPPPPPKLTRSEEAGTACAGGAATCAAEYDRIPPGGDLWPPLFWYPSSTTTTWLVARRGSELVRVTTRKDMLALLGALDHPSKVAVLVRSAGYQIDCAQPWLLATATGHHVRARKSEGDCPIKTFDVTIEVAANGTIREIERKERPGGRGGCVGRRPEGYRELPSAGLAIGAYFAHIARLEAASVVAFEILVDELLAHGAPARLVRAARRARLDEIAHAAVTGELAARHGGRVEPPVIERRTHRTLEDIARENIVEGCVRETWGALEAAWQARRASDPEVRRAMAVIAADELRHAALSWQVDAWIGARLDERTRRAAIDAAIADLAAELAHDRPAELRELAGLPSAEDAAALLGALRDLLWTRNAA